MEFNNILRINHDSEFDLTYYIRHTTKSLCGTHHSGATYTPKKSAMQCLDETMAQIIPIGMPEDEEMIISYFMMDVVTKDRKSPTIHHIRYFIYPAYGEVEYDISKENIFSRWKRESKGNWTFDRDDFDRTNGSVVSIFDLNPNFHLYLFKKSVLESKHLFPKIFGYRDDNMILNHILDVERIFKRQG